MSNIFVDYLSVVSFPIFEILSTYEKLFKDLDIDLSNYEDNFHYWDWDSENLVETLNTILVYEAQSNGIISEYIDVDECFDLEGGFNIKKSECDNYQDIIDKFEDWCGIKINVID